ncbi:MAG: hypothetical protein SGARI_002844 [Bacillariaceae sp.]
MIVGIMNDDTTGHSNHHLGAPNLKNSLGLTNRGDLILNGETIGSGLGFSSADLVSLSFKEGKMSIQVNGSEAVTVKLGAEALTSNQDKFCTQHGVVAPNVMSSVATTVCSDPPSPGKSSDEDTIVGTSEATEPFKRGQVVDYHKNGHVSKAKVVGVHLDNPSDPYYTIDVNGMEKQTDKHHLFAPHKDTVAAEPKLNHSSFKSSITSASSNSTSIAGYFIDASDLKYGGRSLGEGSFGKVFKGKWDDADVAIKEVLWEDKEDQLREIAVGRSLAQPNIATIMGWSRKDGKLLIVMPLFRNGSLADRLSRVNPELSPSPATGGPFGFPFVFRISLGLLRAIKYMASRQPHAVVHRDIKPANILLDDNDQPMLTDFGTARNLMRTMLSAEKVGTPYYMAAEQAKEEETSPATDVYAAALVIYETLCAPRTVHDVTSISMFKLMNAIAMGHLPPFHDVPKEIAAIIEPAFSPDPKSRPSAAKMVTQFEALRDSYGTV